MPTKVQKRGNSLGAQFPRRVFKEVCIAIGAEVDILVQEKRSVVTRSERIRSSHRRGRRFSSPV
jgi:antitoxin component of MazEF toxin-antitoxin module